MHYGVGYHLQWFGMRQRFKASKTILIHVGQSFAIEFIRTKIPTDSRPDLNDALDAAEFNGFPFPGMNRQRKTCIFYFIKLMSLHASRCHPNCNSKIVIAPRRPHISIELHKRNDKIYNKLAEIIMQSQMKMTNFHSPLAFEKTMKR